MAAAGPSSSVGGSRYEGSSDDADGLEDEGGTNVVRFLSNADANGGQSDHIVVERGIDHSLHESPRTDAM
jgi:hypothetical protein